MKQYITVLFLTLILALTVGCQQQEDDNSTEFNATGEKSNWKVVAQFDVSDKELTHHTEFTYSGDGIPKNIRYELKFPDELGSESFGTLSNEENETEFETPYAGHGIGGENKELSYYKEMAEQTSFMVKYTIDDEEKEQEIPLTVE